MISERQLKRYCCGDYTEIENYAEMIVDTTQKWECHHRKELTEDGDFAYSVKDLIKMGEYYDRPAEELIFLTKSEHTKLHKKGKKRKPFTAEHCENLSKANKGKKATDATRERMRKARKGMVYSNETREKLSKASKGTYWYNNGIENKRTFDCPEGFVKGRLKN